MSSRARRSIQRSQPQPPPNVGPTEPTVSDLARAFTSILRGTTTIPTEEVSPEIKKEVDKFVDTELTPQIKEVAVDLLKEEVRDKLYRDQSAIAKIREAVKKHKKVLIKRKRGCIYLQFGTGTPKDPIDEVLIAST